MMNNLPLRLTILHFAQRLRMEGPTFMIAFSLRLLVKPNVELYLFYSYPSSFAGLFCHRAVRMRGSPAVTATECSW